MKNLSPALFLVIVFCFFLPFTEVTCNNETLIKLSGMKLAFGTNATVMGETTEVNMKFFALLPLLLAVGGAAFSIYKIVNKKDTPKDMVLSVIGFAIALCLIILPFTIDDAAEQKNMGRDDDAFSQSMNRSLKVEHSYLFGYYFAILVGVGAGVYHLMGANRIREMIPPIGAVDKSSEPVVHCKKCGQKNNINSTFCSNCGEPINPV